MYLKGLALLPAGERITDNNISRAVRDVCLKIAEQRPRTLIFVTADAAAFKDTLTVLYQPQIDGAAFDLSLLDELHDLCFEADVPTLFLNDRQAKRYNVAPALSSNTRAALTVLDHYFDHYHIAQLTTADQSPYLLYKAGRVLRQAVEKNEKDAVIIALGNLSNAVRDKVTNGHYYSLLKFSEPSRSEAGDGFAPLVLGLGALDGIMTKPHVFGEACWIAYDLAHKDPTYESLLTRYDYEMARKHQKQQAREKDPFVRLAMAQTDRWIASGNAIDIAGFLTEDLSDADREELAHRAAGVYVTVYKSGELRGQMGSVQPREENIAREIVRSTIEAIAYDARFLPVEAPEVPELTFQVTIIGQPEDVEDPSALDPGKYGLIAEKGLRYGVVLPGIPDITTADEQIAAVKRAAGIPEYEEDDEREFGGDKLMLKRFEAEIHRSGKLK